MYMLQTLKFNAERAIILSFPIMTSSVNKQKSDKLALQRKFFVCKHKNMFFVFPLKRKKYNPFHAPIVAWDLGDLCYLKSNVNVERTKLLISVF